MTKITLFTALLAAFAAPFVSDSSLRASSLETGFTKVDTSNRVGCYWWWLDGRVDKPTITRDLEEFAAKGIGEVLLVNSANLHPPEKDPAAVTFLSPEWRALYRHALSEAKRLRIEVGVNLCGGWCMGGPWIPPQHAGRWFLQSRITVTGPRRLSEPLPLPGNRDGYDKVFNPPGYKAYIDLPLEKLDYRDTAVVAFRNPEETPVTKFSGQRAKALPAKTNRCDASNWTPASEVMDPTLIPWDPAATDQPIPVEGVIDLTSRLKPDGTLDWDIPAGRWTIVRTGHRMTGSRLMIPPPEVDGLSVGWLSGDGVELQFKHLGDLLLSEAATVGVKLKYFCDDSFEDGFPNWTEKIIERFYHYRGYNPVPYLPVLSGYIVGNAEISDRFLYDYRKTVASCMADGHYQRFAELCHERGIMVQNESAGPSRSGTMCMDGLMNLGRSDFPAGEFWLGTRHDEPGGLDPKLSYGITRLEEGQNKVTKMVASAAHLYGRPLASAESFTTMRHWQDSPASLKPAADRAFCEGINRLLLHTSTLSRPVEGKPGYEYYAGNHFNPNVTWWNLSGAFLDYLARCQHLLRAGRFVADVLYFNGDWAPNIVPPKRIQKDLGPGYDYDVCNTEILLKRLAVRDGRIVTPEGMSYRLLVLPEAVDMPVDVIRKLDEMVRAGATVIGPRPSRAAGLRDFPNCDRVLRDFANQLWKDCDGKTRSLNRLEKGRVFWGKTAREVLAEDGVSPDFTYDRNSGSLDFIHRTVEGTEVFFVVNKQDKPCEVTCAFRVAGLQPELWDPRSGKIRSLNEYSVEKDVIRIPFRFEAQESWFVVFRSPLRKENNHVSEAQRNFVGSKVLQTFEGPWIVSFDPRWGGPSKVEFPNLCDWTQHADEGVRHYSGTATYQKTFSVAQPPAAGERLLLDLGVVRNIASVRLNGVSLGIVWAAPWQVDITDAVRAGANRLEVDVVNLWPNRMIGDKALPPEKRFTKSNITLKDDVRLLSSGLLGPVTLRSRQTAAP